jgi:hypothetical protein
MTSFVLISETVRRNCISAILNAPDGYIVDLKEPKRSTDQNSMMWSLLGDLARAKPEGRNWTPETYKAAMMHYLGHQVMFAEGLGGTGPFPVGFRTSKLTKRQMADLIDCILSYGAEHGVVFKDTRNGGWME